MFHERSDLCLQFCVPMFRALPGHFENVRRMLCHRRSLSELEDLAALRTASHVLARFTGSDQAALWQLLRGPIGSVCNALYSSAVMDRREYAHDTTKRFFS